MTVEEDLPGIRKHLALTVNGTKVEADIDSRMTLCSAGTARQA